MGFFSDIVGSFTGSNARKARRRADAERARLRGQEKKRTDRLKKVQEQRSLADLATSLFGRSQLKRKKKSEKLGNSSKVSGDS